MVHSTGTFLDLVSEQFYEHEYEFKVDTKTSVLGISNIKKWEVRELNTDQTETYRKSTANLVDGVYIMHWSFSLLTDKTSKQRIRLNFAPRFRTEANAAWVYGVSYYLTLYTNRTYEGYDSEQSGGNMGFGEFAPAVTPDDGDDPPCVRGRLDAIEHNGEIIWQREGYEKPLPSVRL